ncbi:MAG: hypothetical protein U9R49_06490, partial [Bacteroidota bacterium]|nr:hypothetical protein [Bacteroidota bacterium]
ISVQTEVQTEVHEEVQPVAQEEVRTVLAEGMEDQAVQPSPDPPVQRIHNPVMFSVKKEHERPVESGSKMTVISQKDLKTGLLAGSVERINASSPSGEAVPDKIEALYIPPVPVHLSSLTVGQIYDMDLQEVVESYAEGSNFSLLTIANAGIKSINKLAKSDISLMASRNEEGDVSGIWLKGKRFSLSRPLGQKE